VFTGARKPDVGRLIHNWTRQFGRYVWHRGDTSIVLVCHFEQVKLSGYEESSLGGVGLACKNALFTAKSPGELQQFVARTGNSAFGNSSSGSWCEGLMG
jgi:hypothetical protein